MKHAPLYERLTILWVLCYVAATVLGLRLLQVQVLQNVQYSRTAERNRTQTIRRAAPRGRIYDRNGDVVATSQAAFSLIYMPDKSKDETPLRGLARDLDPLLRENADELLAVLQKAVREEAAVRLAENLPPKVMFKLSELKTIYPGINLVVEARRHYPYGAFASHLLGYMGKMDEASWKEYKTKGYRADSRIGKVGLEKLFEQELRGVDGGILMEVDAQGRIRRELERMDWKAGSNLHLTLDARLQRAAEDAIRKSPSGKGAVVALDPRNGAILALTSIPDFDPNQFLLPESTATMKNLPEFNLALSGTFPPGSIFKMITGAAMLNDGRIDPEDKVFCPGYLEVGARVFLCWEKKGHRQMNWLSGLANSCDVYFYRMGQRVGGEAIERYEKLFGLGQKTRIALPGEKRGNVFGPEARRARKLHWHDGDTCNLAIGQGELLVTPLQMANFAAAIANRGTLWRPHFIDYIEYSDRRADPVYKQKPEELGRIPLKPATWDLLHAAMQQVVKAGTGARVAIPGLVIAGKTGTAQNPHGEDHAWFVAFASRENEAPSIALAVLAQHGGHGSEAAGPVARKVLLTAFGMDAAPAAPAAVEVSTQPAVSPLLLRPAQPPAMVR